MNIQQDLYVAMIQVTDARRRLADLEMHRLVLRRQVTIADAELATARIAAMADPAAGCNDAQRRAWADKETAVEQSYLLDCQSSLTDAEIDIADAVAIMRIAEDKRRYLETVVKLMEIGRTDDMMQLAHADNDRPAHDNDRPF